MRGSAMPRAHQTGRRKEHRTPPRRQTLLRKVKVQLLCLQRLVQGMPPFLLGRRQRWRQLLLQPWPVLLKAGQKWTEQRQRRLADQMRRLVTGLQQPLLAQTLERQACQL
mmetsp:Transcript_8807/g.13523  ORF Transcript_8807/g.13523 Transcript_8807/m.13523 type:complete len:110 (+) Transcript_8807:372-701(+)